MEMKTKVLDKKHLLIIIVAIFSIIISYFNVTYAYFSDNKNQPISIKSVNTFGESTVYELNVFIEGNLSYTSEIKNNQTLSFTKDNVDTHDYLLTVATQVDPQYTEYELDEYDYISYEIYHKTEESLDTSTFTCVDKTYNNGDICNTGTFTDNSLDGIPFELLKDYKITDTKTHYFDVYIYLNDNTKESKKFKTRIFFVEKEIEKEVEEAPEYLEAPDIDNTGLVPIKYIESSGKWKVTTQDDPEWYNYNNQKWANAASVKKGIITVENPFPELIVPNEESTESDILAMYVWIPRFSYTIGCLNSETECYGYRLNDDSDKDSGTPSATLPGAIDIKFISVNSNPEDPGIDKGIYPAYKYTSLEDRTPKKWYTHPAFWWDEDNDGQRTQNEELSGIWVGKFETSIETNASCYMTTSDNCLIGETEVRILVSVKSFGESFKKIKL